MDSKNLDTTTPTRSTIIKSALLAMSAAAICTVLFVMPAEYGIDPTGIGAKLGLTELADSGGDLEAARPRTVVGAYPGPPDAEAFDYFDPEVLGEPFAKTHDKAFKTETILVDLDEFEQVEYKAVMQRGDALVFEWAVDDGIVYTDFHADPGDAPGYPEGYFIRYRESETATGAGSIVAPFDGNHGWYWLNIEEHPVRITLRVSGYFERIDELFRSYQ